jgi:hypothetical protein
MQSEQNGCLPFVRRFGSASSLARILEYPCLTLEALFDDMAEAVSNGGSLVWYQLSTIYHNAKAIGDAA